MILRSDQGDAAGVDVLNAGVAPENGNQLAVVELLHLYFPTEVRRLAIHLDMSNVQDARFWGGAGRGNRCGSCSLWSNDTGACCQGPCRAQRNRRFR